MSKIKLMAFAAVAASAMLPAVADLPVGYHQLDYVDTDGTQWVNTIFVPSCTNAVEIKAGILDKLSTSQFLYCTRKATSGNTSQARRYNALCIYSSKPRFDYGKNQVYGTTLTVGKVYVFSTSPCVDRKSTRSELQSRF